MAFVREAMPIFSLGIALSTFAALSGGMGDQVEGGRSPEEAILPPGVKVVWDIEKAYRETTETRERICINGLWQWQPTESQIEKVPTDDWGYFKVPGPWPGITDYMQKDCQIVYRHPKWKDVRLETTTAAWYQRQITIPERWKGRRILLHADYVNSYAAVFIDGRKVGEIVFPAGSVDLTGVCEPGKTYKLSMLVLALPLKGAILAYTDTAAARQVRGSVARRGLCGDLFLMALPKGERIEDLRLESSFRRGTVTVVAKVANLSPNRSYRLKMVVREGSRAIHEVISPEVRGRGLEDGRFVFTDPWRPEKVWDIHTPRNKYSVEVSLLDGSGRTLDEFWTQLWGFREFWIEGRDFYLNGTRIFLSAVPLDNAQVGAAWATYEAACESLRRLKSFGINFVYTHNYDCLPGSHLGFEEILQAADDVGILVALSMPHFAHYDWRSPNAESIYKQHAEFYVRVAGQHPSVVMYAMSHNATGYSEDMNPDLIDGIHEPRDDWSFNNARLALRAEAIVRSLDPTRVIYHHASGNLGSMHTVNFYPNWVPIQELCDWFEHWSKVGVKPLFLCEYGAPFTWDWAMYRGWYKGNREFGSAVVPWDFCLAEWNAQSLGDSAYKISEQEKRNLRWEARQFREGRLWHRWDYPHQLGSSDFDERYPILARYLTECWRAFRTWEVSAISPWEHHIFWKLKPGVARNQRVDLPTDWENLQRPGYSPDFIQERFERMDMAYELSDWLPTLAAEAIYRNNAPLLAFISGPPKAFTSKAHNFTPGSVVEKQLVIINNSRQTVVCRWGWEFRQRVEGSSPAKAAKGKVLARGEGEVEIPTGQQVRQPVKISLPSNLATSEYILSADFQFSTGERQSDQFVIHVLSKPNWRELAEIVRKRRIRIGLFDPHGETAKLLDRIQIGYQPVRADSDVRKFDVLIIGKKALTLENPAPSLDAVRDGLKAIVFEQAGGVLEKRLGFRVAEYGLRNVFRRIPDHPYLAGLTEEHLRDWHGEATLLPPRLEYTLSDRYAGAPTVWWCGLEVPRLWRCGNRGEVASVLIEEPGVGDFLPIVDGGFGLQYSPLLEYREGKGMVLFCQMDVTGRTEPDPAAEILLHNILKTVFSAEYPVIPEKRAFYIGDRQGKNYLQRLGIEVADFIGQSLSPKDVLIVGKGASERLSNIRTDLAKWLKAGGQILCLGLDEQEANSFLPVTVRMEQAEYINAYFSPPPLSSPFVGIGPADVHNRDPRILSLLCEGCDALGGVLGQARQYNIVFCQLLPWHFVKRPHDLPEFRVTSEEAYEGKHCAEIVMATVPWAQFGQKLAAGEVGKDYTFAVCLKSLDEPATVRLEVERAGAPWDRVVKGQDVTIQPNRWTEIHLTFSVKQAYPEGWQAYLHIGQPEVRLRVDGFRLYEGAYQPRTPGSSNLLKNPGFEEGSSPWYFNWTTEQQNLRKTFRRTSFMLSRLLGSLGVRPQTPLLERFASPVVSSGQPSIVRNGQFLEDSDSDGVPNEWILSTENLHATCALEDLGPTNPKRCVRIDVPGSPEGRRATVMLAQHGIPIREGQWYRLEFWARGEGLRQVLVAVQETIHWQAVLEYKRFMPTVEWRRFVFLLPGRGTAEKNTRLQIWFEGKGTLWLADFRIVPCDPPMIGRWLTGLYLDTPQEWDDPYRFFRW
jgi:beta-galactosidase